MEELTAHLASLLWSYLDSFLLLVGEPAYEGYDLCVDVKARQRKPAHDRSIGEQGWLDDWGRLFADARFVYHAQPPAGAQLHQLCVAAPEGTGRYAIMRGSKLMWVTVTIRGGIPCDLSACLTPP